METRKKIQVQFFSAEFPNVDIWAVKNYEKCGIVMKLAHREILVTTDSNNEAWSCYETRIWITSSNESHWFSHSEDSNSHQSKQIQVLTEVVKIKNHAAWRKRPTGNFFRVSKNCNVGEINQNFAVSEVIARSKCFYIHCVCSASEIFDFEIAKNRLLPVGFLIMLFLLKTYHNLVYLLASFVLRFWFFTTMILLKLQTIWP